MTALDARVFDDKGQPIDVHQDTLGTKDLIDDIMPYIKRRKQVAFIPANMWERIEAWYGLQGLVPLTSQVLTELGVPNVVFLGVAWVRVEDKPEGWTGIEVL